MNKQWVEITYFTYLKNPYYHWTVHNDMGGSFSNSGQHRSFKKCVEEMREMTNHAKLDVNVYAIDVDGNKTLERRVICAK